MQAVQTSSGTSASPQQSEACFDSAAAWLQRLDMRPGVTVLIPVFNGLDQLQRLLDNPALWEGQHDVLLVDDASTDACIAPLLRTTAQAKPRCRVISNARNLGFVRSVNVGIRELPAKHDVIVLNSDAHPPPGWILALSVCAYAFDNVATVSPLSNAAGFFSVPEPNAVNALPQGCSLQDCADALLLAAPALTETALSTCGFCWYVTRHGLDTVGRLDEYMFYRGYAEESDFCLRAIDHEMRNLVALSLFVEHVGGQSFSSEKQELKTRNASILKAMQPDFLIRLRAYEGSSAVPEIGTLFQQAVLQRESRRALLCEAGRVKRLVLAETNSASQEIDGGRSAAQPSLRFPLAASPGGKSLEELAVQAILRFRPHLVDVPPEWRGWSLIAEAAALVGGRMRSASE